MKFWVIYRVIAQIRFCQHENSHILETLFSMIFYSSTFVLSNMNHLMKMSVFTMWMFSILILNFDLNFLSFWLKIQHLFQLYFTLCLWSQFKLQFLRLFQFQILLQISALKSIQLHMMFWISISFQFCSKSRLQLRHFSLMSWLKKNRILINKFIIKWQILSLNSFQYFFQLMLWKDSEKENKKINKKIESQPLIEMFDEFKKSYNKFISIRQILKKNKIDLFWINFIVWFSETCRKFKKLCIKIAKKKTFRKKSTNDFVMNSFFSFVNFNLAISIESILFVLKSIFFKTF